MSLIRDFYRPLLINELNIDMQNIINKGKTFCIYGNYGVGKSRCILTHLECMNFEITYITENDYTENIEETLNSRKNVFSFFSNKKEVVVLDDYPHKFPLKIDKFCIYICNKKLTSLLSVEILSPDTTYLNDLAQAVIFLEGKNFLFNSKHTNFITFWSDLEMSLTNNRQIGSEFFFKPNTKNIIETISKSSVEKSTKMVEYLHDYTYIQHKILKKINNIDDYSSAINCMSEACALINSKYYGIESIIHPIYYI